MTTPDERSRVTRAHTTGSQLTAGNQSIQIDGDSLSYRRFGNEQTDAPPLIWLQHFRGNLDSCPRPAPHDHARRRQGHVTPTKTRHQD
jgi:hypothetical protein